MHDESPETILRGTTDHRPGGSAVALHGELRGLSLVEKAGFSLGDAACNMFFQTWILYSMFFYTDVFGLAANRWR